LLVSVVVPVLNEAENIERTIAAARRHYEQDAVEIIVVDGGSTDGTPDLIEPPTRLLYSSPGRAVQMNQGAEVARGEILLFCHGDTQLPAGWREAVVEALCRPGVSGGSFAIRFLPPRGILHVINSVPLPANWRVMYGDQAQFTRRETFRRVGGFPEIPAMEDIEMMRALHKVGRVVRVPLRVTSSSRRFLERGPLRQMWLNVSVVLRYLFFGVTAEQIAREYYITRRDER
jgi:rSAM/selenodomain-associated transferase 2